MTILSKQVETVK